MAFDVEAFCFLTRGLFQVIVKVIIGHEIAEKLVERMILLELLNRRIISDEGREKMSESKLGNLNPNYKGGFSIKKDPRKDVPCRENSKHALKRDNYQCRVCGNDKINSKLHVHHIMPVKTHEHLANSRTNVVTLCSDCHYKAEKHKFTLEYTTENCNEFTLKYNEVLDSIGFSWDNDFMKLKPEFRQSLNTASVTMITNTVTYTEDKMIITIDRNITVEQLKHIKEALELLKPML